MSALKVFLFGAPRLETNATPVEIKRRKTLALFVYLAVTQKPHSRDTLATLLWPDHDQSGARANLRRDISRLKNALGDGVLNLDGDHVSLNPDADLWLDLDIYQSKSNTPAAHPHSPATLCPDCAKALTEAVDLYNNGFLAGFTLPGSPEFDDWQFFETESLRRKQAEALEKLVEWHTVTREFDQAIGYARHWLALDNLHEPAHQALMRLFTWSGEQAAAIRQYKECARLLGENLNLEPDQETRALYEAIRARRLPSPENITVPDGSAPRQPALLGLPGNISPFIGRENEISSLMTLLAGSEARLVTIVGLGGAGKTRLAAEIATRLVEEHPALVPDGVAFVSLASVDKPNALPFAMAKDLGFSLCGQIDPRAEILNLLRKKRMLLILDNFEQLVANAPLLEDLLNACPEIKVLVTSREPLRLSFEWRFDLDGLPYPRPDTTQADELASVRLLLQCARQVKPEFELTNETRPLVYHLCATLAGLPLAIKLSASWLRVMSLDQIVKEVERSLDLLTSQMQDIPDRQRSINAVFEATWEMLSSEEQRAFASLASFRGGFSNQAARQVADVSPYLLAGLVDRGLVRLVEDGRYEIHELTRQFAAAKQSEQEGIDLFIAEKHSRYYLAFLVGEGPQLYGQAPQISLEGLKKDLSNIRNAWEWAVEHLPTTELEPAIEPLAAFYEIAGYLQAGEQAFWPAILRHERTAHTEKERRTLCNLLLHHAFFLIFQGQWKTVHERLPQIRRLAEALRYDDGVADTYQLEGLTRQYLSQAEESIVLYRRAIDIYRSQGNQRRLAYTLNHLGEALSFRQKSEEAIECHTEAMRICQAIADSRLWALSLSHQGVAYYYLGHLEKAIHCWEQASGYFDEFGDLRDAGRTRNNLGFAYNLIGDFEKAAQNAEMAVTILGQIGDRLNEAYANDTLGRAYMSLGDYAAARLCFESALGYNQEHGLLGSDEISYRTNLAMIELDTGHLSAADEQLQRANSILQPETHPKTIARFLGVCAQFYARSGQLDQAMDAFEAGIRHALDAGDQHQRGELLVKKASFLFAGGKPDLAEKVLNEARKVLDDILTPTTQFEADLLAARVMHAQGRLDEASQKLNQMHQSSKRDVQHADIHYALWQLHAGKENARLAYELYRELWKKTPNVEYRERLQELRSFARRRKLEVSPATA